MAKLRKGITVVLKLDDLFQWIRNQNRNKLKNGDIPNGKAAKNKKKKFAARFKIVNRPCDFNKLPPCRAKIVYLGIPKCLKSKRLIFGLQLYPPYFGLSKRLIKSQNQQRILGKIAAKELKAPLGSILFVTESEIKGVMLAKSAISIACQPKQTTHRISPHLMSASQNAKHLDMRSSSKSPKFSSESKQADQSDSDLQKAQKHFRRKSSMSMASHYRNLDSLANFADLSDSMFWRDDQLPSHYMLPTDLPSSQAHKIHASDPRQRRFKLERWLYPIFLDYSDAQTTEIVKGMEVGIDNDDDIDLV